MSPIDRDPLGNPAVGAGARGRTSARALREERRAATAEELERERVALGITQADCARSAGMPPQHYQQLEDPEHPRNLGHADAEGLPLPLQHALIRRWAARLGLVVSEAPDVESAEDMHEHLAATLKECSDVATETIRGLGDGELCATDRATVHRETGDAIEKLTALHEATRPEPPRRLVPRPVPYDTRGRR